MIESGKLMNLADGQVLYNDLRKRDINKEDVLSYKEAIPGETVEVYDAVAEAVKQMQIEIAPVQDLHGYDKPWVGGAGKNLCPDDVSEFSVSGEGWFSLSGVGASTWTYGTKVHLKAGTYKRSFSNLDNITTVQTFDSNGNLMTITSGTIVMGSEGDIYIRIKATGNISLKTQIEEGSTVTDWEPYSNICPISGFTGCEVTRTGFNIWDEEWEAGAYNTFNANGDGSKYTVSGYSRVKNLIQILPNTLYYLLKPDSTSDGRVAFYDENKNYLGYSNVISIGTSTGISFTSPAKAHYLSYYKLGDIAGSCINVYDAGKNGTYEPGKIDQYTITFPSGQTVYGGTLTVNADGTGTLVVDWSKIILTGTENWSKESSGNTSFFRITGFSRPYDASSTVEGNTNKRCSHFKQEQVISSTTDTGFTVYHYPQTSASILNIRPNNVSGISVDDWKAYLAQQNTAETPVVVVYKLATPTSIPLTAPQIRTIIGYNRIYANTGSIMSMLYPAERYQTADQADKERIHAVVDEPSAVVSVTDGADNVPMGMQIAIEPVQDLHGYDNPWPAGGGKNLFDKNSSGNATGKYLSVSTGELVNSGAGYDTSDYIPITDGQTYTISGFSITGATEVCFYDVSKVFIPGSGISSTSHTFTAPTGAVYLRFDYKHIDIDAMQLEKGSTATAYAPYSNICPITGWTGAEISRTGKNLIDESTAALGNLDQTTGAETDSTSVKRCDFMPVKGGQNIYVTISVSMRIFWYKKDKTYISNQVIISSSSIEVPDNASYFRMVGLISAWDGGIMINYGSIALEYQAFAGSNRYTITFPDSAGIVYGGTLTVDKDGTGELVVDGATVTFDGSSDETINNGNASGLLRMLMRLPNDALVTGYGVSNSLSWKATAEEAQGANTVHWYKYPDSSSVPGVFADCRFTVGTYDNTSDSTRRAYLAQNPIQFVYELSEKVTYTLPAPVIRSLLGTNNVWADTGNVLHLDYTADTKSYIDNLFASLTNATGRTF